MPHGSSLEMQRSESVYPVLHELFILTCLFTYTIDKRIRNEDGECEGSGYDSTLDLKQLFSIVSNAAA